MSALCQKRTLARLLDHLVGAHKEGLWDLQAHSLRGLQIHDQLELHRHLHRKIGRLCPTKNLVDVGCGLTIRVGGDVPVGVYPSKQTLIDRIEKSAFPATRCFYRIIATVSPREVSMKRPAAITTGAALLLACALAA